MTWFANSLWEMITAPLTASRRPALAVSRRQRRAVAVMALPKPNGDAVKPAKRSMQDRYDALVEEMKTTHNLRVRKWRKSSSGVAWTIRYIQSGRIVKLIESPYPRGPMSCAIFLHEIGHHAIGLGVYRPRCLEEYHVGARGRRRMRQKALNARAAVERRMERSKKYAVEKARRRGLKELPEELRQYL